MKILHIMILGCRDDIGALLSAASIHNEMSRVDLFGSWLSDCSESAWNLIRFVCVKNLVSTSTVLALFQNS